MTAACANFSTERLLAFSSIKNDYVSEYKEGRDLFIGKNSSVTVTLKNGSTTRFADIVVLGKLIIKSSNPADLQNKPKFICRDMVVAGELSVTNIHLHHRNAWEAHDRDGFYQTICKELGKRCRAD
jgi:hypothetical protein